MGGSTNDVNVVNMHLQKKLDLEANRPIAAMTPQNNRIAAMQKAAKALGPTCEYLSTTKPEAFWDSIKLVRIDIPGVDDKPHKHAEFCAKIAEHVGMGFSSHAVGRNVSFALCALDGSEYKDETHVTDLSWSAALALIKMKG